MQALPLLAPSSVCVMCNSITLLTMMTTKMICQSNWERISHICFDTLPWRQFSRAQRSEWKKKRHKIRLLTTHLHDSHHTQMASEWVGCRWKGQEWRRPMWNGFSVLAVFVCAWFDRKKLHGNWLKFIDLRYLAVCFVKANINLVHISPIDFDRSNRNSRFSSPCIGILNSIEIAKVCLFHFYSTSTGKSLRFVFRHIY